MGALCCVRSVGLLIVFLVWLFIPHHFAGAQSYGAMVVLCVFSVVLFSKMRVQRKRILLKKKQIKLINGMCIGVVGLNAVTLFPVAFFARVYGNIVFFVLSVITMMTSIFVLCCRIIVSENEEEKLFHGEFLLTVQCITSLMLVLVFVKVQHPCVSIRPIIRVVCICSSLAVCLISYYVNLVKLTSREFECVFVLCMVCAVLLTLYLNVFLDSSSGSVCTYIAFDEYKNATRCTLKNGYDFSYRGCPTPIGCSGRIRQFDGWFNLSYLIPIG